MQSFLLQINLDNVWTGVIIWLVVLIVSLYIEIVTTELVSIWFSIGSLLSAILAALRVSFSIQLVIFGVVSFVSLLLAKTTFKKMNTKVQPQKITLSLIGKQIVVDQGASSLKSGKAIIDGVSWDILAKDQEVSKDDVVSIVAVYGNKLIVKK
jgi:membrane protein implicated in regulation of membrane protease activity